MKRFFGTPKKEEPTQPVVTLPEASQKLDESLAALDQKIRSCDEELAKFKAQMTKSKVGAQSVKQRALTVLKRKKMYEQQRDQIMATQFNIDQTQFTTEQLETTTQTVAAMKVASTNLKQEFKKIDINEIEKVQDDLADLMLDHEDVNEILGRSYAVNVDDAELDAEFAMLADEVLQEGKQEEGLSLVEAQDETAAPCYLPTC